MLSQKQAILNLVKQLLPTFVSHKSIALVMLTKDQLEQLKQSVYAGMMSGQIEYSKGTHNPAEVLAYSRSVVMNWLKKGKELNGNQIYGVGPVVVQSKPPKALADIDMDLLSDDLKAFVNTLV
jgi:hypothetical protein